MQRAQLNHNTGSAILYSGYIYLIESNGHCKQNCFGVPLLAKCASCVLDDLLGAKYFEDVARSLESSFHDSRDDFFKLH